MGKVSSGELDAVVVARAGLARIGNTQVIAEAFDPVVLLPAPAQGALAVECRVDDAQLVSTLATLDDPSLVPRSMPSARCWRPLEAGCTAPVGAYAEVVESLDDDGRIFLELSLRAAVAAIDGSDVIRSSMVGPIEQAADVGRALAAEMLESGAASLLA